MTTLQLIKELNSPTKIWILCWVLKEKRLTVSFLTENTKFERNNISKQICELYEVGVLDRESEGKNNYYSLHKGMNELLVKTIKDVVNAYHIIDLNEGDTYVPY